MATIQRRKKREPFLDANGAPLSSGYLQYFRAGTTTALTTYSDAAGTNPNATVTIPDRPDLGALIQLDGSGFTQEPIYLQSSYDAKEVLLSATLSTISTEDNIPKGLPDFVAPAYSRLESPWTAISTSTVLTAADAGTSYKATPGASTLTVTLPDAVATGNGRGFTFQKLGLACILAFATAGGQFVNGLSSYAVIAPGSAFSVVSDGANWVLSSDYGVPVSAPGGRLTLAAGTPVLGADVTGASTVYYTLAGGSNTVPVWNGFYFEQMPFSSDLTLDLTAALTANGAADVFAFRDAGALKIGFGPMWLSAAPGASNRGTGAGSTELAWTLGFRTNANTITLTNGANTYGLAAGRATYLGSLFADATPGQVSCHVAYGQSRKWGVWNAYNRRPIRLAAGDPTASWSPDLTIRPWNANATNAVTAFTGLAEEMISVITNNNGMVGSGVALKCGVGVNSTTAFTGNTGYCSQTLNNTISQDISSFNSVPSILGISVLTGLQFGHTSAQLTGTEQNCLLSADYLG
jgi:hypothetical protein